MIDTITTGPDLAGRSASITGAARGIGLAIAEAFVSAGANVLLLDINGDELKKVQHRLAESHPDNVVEVSTVSVTEPDRISDALNQFAERTGSLDLLVNNAGVAANAPSLDLDLTTWRRAIDINLTGVFVCAQAAGRVMNGQGAGNIINISSMYGVISAPQRAAYCSSKAAVASLTKVLAVEWATHGIRVNAIAPGYVDTDLIAGLAIEGRVDIDSLKRRTPIGRLATARDIANLALFLASDVSSNITGQVIVTDGGWTADGFGIETV